MIRSRRVTTYVLWELAGPTVLGLFLYMFVLLMNHFFLVADKALAKNMGAELTLRLFAVGVPRLLVLAIPMAVLLGTLIAVGRLAADHEWIALQSSGRGPGVLLLPIVIQGLVAAGVSFAIYAIVVPQANYTFRNLRAELFYAGNLKADLKPRGFYDLPGNAVLFVDEIRPGVTRRLEGVLLIQTDPRDASTELILAREGELQEAPKGEPAALLLDLYQGVAHQFDIDNLENYRLSPHFKRLTRRLDLASYLEAFLEPPDKGVMDFSIGELWREYLDARAASRQLTQRGAAAEAPADSFVIAQRTRMTTIELHQRLALPATALIFAILALPLGARRQRSGKGAGFAMSLGVILVYWVTFTLARNQAAVGTIPAALGPWAGNLLLLPWAAYGLRRMRWGARRGFVSRGVAAAAAPLTGWLARSRPRPGRAAREDHDAVGELIALGGTRSHFVGRLDRHLAAQYLRVFLFALASAYLIYGLVELKNVTEDMLRSGQSPGLIVDYFKYFWPGVLHVVLPISCLVGAIVAFTLFGRTGELVAIKASGVSMRRATVPVLLLTALAGGLLYLVQDRLAPGSNQHLQVLRDRIAGRAPRTHGLPANGRWSFGPEGRRLYHYRVFDPASQVFQGLSVFTLDRSVPRIIDHRFAKRARWNGRTWELEGSTYRTFPIDSPERPYEVHDETIELALDAPENFAGEDLTLGSSDDLAEQMSAAQLREHIATLDDRGYDVTQLRVAYHSRFARAAAPLVMVLLGLPFGLGAGKRGSLYGIGVALVLVLVYWATLALFHALGLETLLRPIVAAWAPNLLFGLLGGYLLLFVKT